MNQVTNWRDQERPSPYPYDWFDRPKGQNLDRLRAASGPASEREIAEQLALLLKAYPNVGAADGEVFGALLIEDVVDVQPSIGDIQEACRYLRRTSKFLPRISEVLEALADARDHRICYLRSYAAPPAPKLARPAPQIEQHQAIDLSVSQSEKLNPLPL